MIHVHQKIKRLFFMFKKAILLAEKFTEFPDVFYGSRF